MIVSILVVVKPNVGKMLVEVVNFILLKLKEVMPKTQQLSQKVLKSLGTVYLLLMPRKMLEKWRIVLIPTEEFRNQKVNMFYSKTKVQDVVFSEPTEITPIMPMNCKNGIGTMLITMTQLKPTPTS